MSSAYKNFLKECPNHSEKQFQEFVKEQKELNQHFHQMDKDFGIAMAKLNDTRNYKTYKTVESPEGKNVGMIKLKNNQVEKKN